jgi:hypothetical protein
MQSEIANGDRPELTSLVGASAAPSQTPAPSPHATPSPCKVFSWCEEVEGCVKVLIVLTGDIVSGAQGAKRSVQSNQQHCSYNEHDQRNDEVQVRRNRSGCSKKSHIYSSL